MKRNSWVSIKHYGHKDIDNGFNTLMIWWRVSRLHFVYFLKMRSQFACGFHHPHIQFKTYINMCPIMFPPSSSENQKGSLKRWIGFSTIFQTVNARQILWDLFAPTKGQVTQDLLRQVILIKGLSHLLFELLAIWIKKLLRISVPWKYDCCINKNINEKTLEKITWARQMSPANCQGINQPKISYPIFQQEK